jgi:hypothetical protein
VARAISDAAWKAGPRQVQTAHQRMKKTRYKHKLKLGITPAQAKWIKQQDKARALSEAQVVRTAVDHARGCVTVHQ